MPTRGNNEHAPWKKEWWYLAAANNPDPIAFVSRAGQFRWCNQAFCRLLGYAFGELTAMSWPEITHPHDIGGDQQEVERVLRGEIPEYYMEKRYRHRDGTWLPVSLWVYRCPEIGEVDGFVVFIRRAEANQTALPAELDQSKEHLEEAVATIAAMRDTLNFHEELLAAMAGKGNINISDVGSKRNDADVVKYALWAVLGVAIVLGVTLAWVVGYYGLGGGQDKPEINIPIEAPK